MSARYVWRQGEMDGFCGVYSILNFLSFSGESDTRIRKAFLVALRTIEDSGQLSAKNVSSGIWQGQLIKAANAVFQTLKLEIYADTLGMFRRSVGTDDPFQLVREIGSKGGLVFNFRSPGHWMFVHSGSERQFIAMDSAEGEERYIRAAYLKERKIEISKGLVFLYAKTH